MSERSSYLYLKCEQCGVEKLLYHEDTTAEDRTAELNAWQLIHDGHEAKVGIKATLANTYDPETQMIVPKHQPPAQTIEPPRKQFNLWKRNTK